MRKCNCNEGTSSRATEPDKAEIQTQSYLRLAGQPLQNKWKRVLYTVIHVFKLMVVLWRVSVPPIQSPTPKIMNQSWKFIIKDVVDVFNIIKLDNIPSSSETSKISSTVSGKLIRCFSVVICEEHTEVARAGDMQGQRSERIGKEREESRWKMQARELNLTETIVWLNVWVTVCQGYFFAYWRNHVNHAWCVAHRGDRLLGNQFQHIYDRDVTQPLSDTQGRCPVLYRERRETSRRIFSEIFNSV